jgi:DNA adenine methylase
MFRYPGGKNKLRKIIVEDILFYYDEKCSNGAPMYVEPFLGAGSIGINLLSTKKVSHVCLNDYDIGIFCFWMSVLDYPDYLCSLVDDFVPSVEKFYEFKEFLLSVSRKFAMDNIVDVGFKKMAIHQISYSGLGVMSGGPLGGKDQTSSYPIGCRWSPSHLKSNIRSVHNLLKQSQLHQNKFLCKDFRKVINSFSNQRVFYYLDPPYYEKGPELYQYAFGEEDHRCLASLLKECTSPWILSYDNHDRIRELYSWAFIKEVKISCTINTKKSSSVKNEFLITSPSYRYLIDKKPTYDIEIDFNN